MKFLVLWSGLCCYTEGWGGKCSEIFATIKLLYNPRVNIVFTIYYSPFVGRVGNRGGNINWDASPVSSPATVFIYCGEVDKVLDTVFKVMSNFE